jgi:RNA polymerase sigma-70 factor (ECF subfamily)
MNVLDNDKEILSLFRENNTQEKAFKMLVHKYQERLYWYVRRMVVQHEDANDILQNVFVKAWKGLHNFREESRLFTWLYKIATNESLTFLEQKKKRTAVSFDSQGVDLTESIKADRDFDARKIEWKLQLAVQQLPEKQRIVFNLRYYDEMPYETMSNLLETSEGALKASYHHAVKKIENFILNH